MTAWGALNARARGLGTHLLAPHDLVRLAGQPDLPSLRSALAGLGFVVPDGATPEGLERAVRRRAAADFATLGRWAGPQTPPAIILFDDEDCRSLRVIVRGALQGVAPERRLAGLIPTPSLPERALETLARLDAPRDIANLLDAWHLPAGAALRAPAQGREPDALRLEAALSAAFAERAARQARRGGRELRRWVRLRIDVENALTALLLLDAPDVAVADVELPGGRAVTGELLRAAVRLGDWGRAARRLATAFAEAPVRAAFLDAARDPAGIERGVLGALLAAARHRARMVPLGPAPLISFALRVRAQVMDLQRIVWGVALGADAHRVRAALLGAA